MQTKPIDEMTTAKVEAALRRCEAERSMLADEQARLVAELDRRQSHTAAGHRSIHEWVAGRLDVGPETASTLVALARLDHPAVWRDLAAGEITVDRALAAATAGRAGAEVLGGPRVGPNVLEEILCGGKVEVDVAGARPLAMGPSASAIAPRVRRFVIARDGGMCTMAGCRSRHRLQVHHIAPRSRGGTNDPANLTTVCWHHHHVAIHGKGFRIDPRSPPYRRRLLPPARGP